VKTDHRGAARLASTGVVTRLSRRLVSNALHGRGSKGVAATAMEGRSCRPARAGVRRRAALCGKAVRRGSHHQGAEMSVSKAAALAVAAILACPALAAAQTPAELAQMLVVRSLDGTGNNLGHLDWGKAGTPYLRVAPTNYADGVARPVAGPPTRYV